MKKFLFLTSLFAMTMGVITGCSEKEPDPVPPPVDGITLTLSIPTPAFKFDSETAFTVMASKAVESDLTVNLTSSNPAAATVPASVVIKAGTDKAEGKVTGVAEGKSTIKIEAAGVEYTTQSIEVDVTKDTPPAPVKPNVSISTTFAEVAPGAEIPFKVVAEKASENDMVINVTSDKPAFATVPATVTIPKGETTVSGKITGVAAGEAKITITSDNATVVNGSITVTVKEGAATAVELTLASASNEMEVGDKLAFTITTPVAPEAALTINLTSSTANATVPATIELPAGKMSVTGHITGALIGEAKITMSAEGTTIKNAELNVTVKERSNISYCEIDFNGDPSYSKVNWFKIGDVEVAGENRATVVGEGPLAGTYELELNATGDYGMDYDGDEYTAAIFADWNRSGKFVKVTSKTFPLNRPASKVSGTFDIPESISSKSVIRVVCYFSGERSGSAITSEGCGKSESGGALDFTYTQE